MAKEKIVSWILLSLAYASQNGPACYKSISDVADGINHSVPSHSELQKSLLFLIDNGIVDKKNMGYKLTKLGVGLIENAKSNTTMKTWKKLESEIRKIR